MKRSTKHYLSTAIAWLLWVSASLANAQIVNPPPIPLYDAKVHHSSECQPMFSVDQFGNALTGWVYFEHSLENRNRPDQSTQVVCPIVRDNARNTNGTVGVEIYVTSVAVTQNQNYLSCALYSYDMYDALLAQSPPAIAYAPGRQTLKVTVDKSASKGHYSLRCLLPSGAKLHAYEVREWLNGTVNRTDWFN